MIFFAEPSFNDCCKYSSFSESERVERSCTETQNWSQKEHQFRMFPSKVGMSSFGSLTPLLSEEKWVEPIGGGVEGERFLLISTEESKTSFSRETN